LNHSDTINLTICIVPDGSHALQVSVADSIMETLHFNGIYAQEQVMWEIGMGVPFLAMYYCGLFKKVVATDISIGVYACVVNTLESLAQYHSLSTSSTPKITKVIKRHPHQSYVVNTTSEGRRAERPRKVKKVAAMKNTGDREGVDSASASDDGESSASKSNDDDDYRDDDASGSSSSDDDTV